jgi:hypothetical protein
MTFSDLAYRDLAVAFAAGLLLGIERGGASTCHW